MSAAPDPHWAPELKWDSAIPAKAPELRAGPLLSTSGAALYLRYVSVYTTGVPDLQVGGEVTQ